MVSNTPTILQETFVSDALNEDSAIFSERIPVIVSGCTDVDDGCHW